MTDAAVILPVCAHDPNSLYISLTAIRTLAASTSAPILVMANNCFGEFKDSIKANCDALGVGYFYYDEPFNMAKVNNLGAQMTTGKYIAYATADVVFYPNWLENLIELWEENPKYFCVCNWSFDTRGIPCTHNRVRPERRIIDCHNPSAGVLVFKRESGFKWDEQFALWEIDSDVYLHLERNKLLGGCCLNSRCDHGVGSIRSTPGFDYKLNMGITNVEEQFFKDPRRCLERKYGLAKQYD